MNSGRASAWTRYWSTGASHSCAGSYGETYAGPFAPFWRCAFDALRDGAKVLDLACGNAPLARLLLSTRSDPGLHCDAVDLADIAPAWARDEPRLRVYGRVAAESLPLSDGRYDLIVSQYGLEYSDLDRAVPELHRVRAPGGAMRFVLHHAGSLPVSLAREELAHLAWATGPEGLLAATEGILPFVARASTPEGRRALGSDRHAEAARARFNAAQASATARLRDTACPDPLHELRESIARILADAQRSGDLATAARELAAIHLGTDDARLRLEELCAHALDVRGASALADRLRRPSDRFTLEPLEDQGRLMAWGLAIGP